MIAISKLRDVWDRLFGRRETFYRVELDGSWFIGDRAHLADIEIQDQADNFPDGWCSIAPGGDHYTITPVRMTRRQLEQLPEFEGF